MKIKLTGKCRYRIGQEGFWKKTPKLILQVEECQEYQRVENAGASVDIEDIKEFRWRDARIEDDIFYNYRDREKK